MSRRWTPLALALGLVTAAATASSLPAAFALHDALGRLVSGPQLPVILVSIDSTPDEAARQATQAGARSVQMALPPAHPLLEGAPPELRRLRTDRDGRIRYSDGMRLRLPEALPALRRMNESQLVNVEDTRPLEGMDVVVAYDIEGMGRTALVPGKSLPVDRGLVLAVAQGSHAAGVWLKALPPWAAALLTGILAALFTLRTRRTTPTAAWGWTGGATVLVLAVAVGARAASLDLPIGGLLLAALLPGPLRLLTASSRTLEALDSLSLRVGGLYRWSDENIGSIEGLPTLLAMSFPGVQVAAFGGGPTGSPERLSHSGSGAEAIALDDLPTDATGSNTRHEEPIYERGRLVGALVLAHPTAIPSAAIELARVSARRTAWQYGTDSDEESDPIQARLGVLRRGLLHTVKTVTSWQALLAGGEHPIGIFDRSGDLVAGNRALRETLGEGREAPLVRVLRALLPDEETVRDVMGGLPEARLPHFVSGGTPGMQLRLSPLFHTAGSAGVLLQVERLDSHDPIARNDGEETDSAALYLSETELPPPAETDPNAVPNSDDPEADTVALHRPAEPALLVLAGGPDLEEDLGGDGERGGGEDGVGGEDRDEQADEHDEHDEHDDDEHDEHDDDEHDDEHDDDEHDDDEHDDDEHDDDEHDDDEHDDDEHDDDEHDDDEHDDDEHDDDEHDDAGALTPPADSEV